MVNLLEALRESPVAVLTAAEVGKRCGLGRRDAGERLRRLRDAGLVRMVERGTYALPGTDVAAVASALGKGYVSFLSALARHGLTTQIPREVTVVGPRRRLVEFGETTIRVVALPAFRRFGGQREFIGGKAALIATPVKAVVDGCYLPEHCPLSESYRAIQEGSLPAEELVEAALRMRSNVALKRIGYLLERAGTDVHARVRGKLGKGFERLDPLGPAEGERDRKWRLVINERLEEL